MEAKDYAKTPEVDADAGETQLGFIRWLMIPSQIARCFYDVFMMFFYVHFRTSRQREAGTTITPNLKTLLTMCPSEVNFGTV